MEDWIVYFLTQTSFILLFHYSTGLCLLVDTCTVPIVVRRVPAKKMDCPKVQLGSAIVTFFVADTPLLVATTILAINFSNLSSKTKQMGKNPWTIGRSIHFYNSSWIFNICSKNLSSYFQAISFEERSPSVHHKWIIYVLKGFQPKNGWKYNKYRRIEGSPRCEMVDLDAFYKPQTCKH